MEGEVEGAKPLAILEPNFIKVRGGGIGFNWVFGGVVEFIAWAGRLGGLLKLKL